MQKYLYSMQVAKEKATNNKKLVTQPLALLLHVAGYSTYLFLAHRTEGRVEGRQGNGD